MDKVSFRSAFIGFFLLLGQFVFSQYDEVQEVTDQDSAKSEIFIESDSLVRSNYSTDHALYTKSFAPNYKNKYKGNDFDYEVLKPKPSIWDRIKLKIAELLSKIFKDLDPNKANLYTVNILRIIGIVVLAFLIFILVRYLLSKEGNFLFGKKNRKINIRTQDLEENIHEINFLQTISQLEQQQDYRSAIRYQFLFALKKLTDKNLISWNPEKTNRDYLRELKNENQREDFRRIVYVYDYIWYGEFDTQEKEYQYYKTYFNKF